MTEETNDTNSDSDNELSKESQTDDSSDDLLENPTPTDPNTFKLHFFQAHATRTSCKDPPSISVRAFIAGILESGSLCFSGTPSSQDEAHLIFAFAAACANARPYLRYLPPIFPWKDVAQIVDDVFILGTDYRGVCV